jgi:hypothetical protein
MNTKWKLVYGGNPNGLAACGYSAPSWGTFDKRVWERSLRNGETLTLVLRNLTNDFGVKPVRRIAMYRVVVLYKDGSWRNRIGHSEEGTDWQSLVSKAKEICSKFS